MARDTSKQTARQREYLVFIQDFTDRWGIPPSFDEIGNHFRTTPPSVNNMVKTLEARGFLTRVPGRARTLRVIVQLEEERTTEATVGSSSQNPEIEAAVRIGCMVIERLVPSLKGVSAAQLHAALDAVREGVDLAVVTAGGTEAQRDKAFETIRLAAMIAQGMTPESRPSGRRWVRRR